MNLKKIFFLLFGLFTFTGYSQTIKITGVLKNKSQNLVNEFVYLVDTQTNTIKKYTKTTSNGSFLFDIDNSLVKNLALQCKAMQYNAILIPVEKGKTFYEIELIEKVNVLEQVVLKNQVKMVKRTGDTIRYKLNQFANKNDKTLNDVLKKIPGIEVANNGDIKYQGLPISNFFIDGDDILSKKYKIATENLTPEMIDDLQVLENNQPIKVLTGKVIPKNAALNITFKDKFKGKLIQSLITGIGVGYQNLYSFKYNNFWISKKLKSLNFLKFNTTGDNYLSEGQSTSFEKFISKLEINFNEDLLNVNTANLPPIKEKRYNNNQNLAASSNFSFKIAKEINFKSNTFFSNDFVRNNLENNVLIEIPGFAIKLNEKNNFSNKYNYLNKNFTATKNTSNIYIKNDLDIKLYVAKDISEIVGSNLIDQNLKTKNYSVTNNFNVISTFKSILIQFNSDFFAGSENQNMDISSGILPQIFNNSLLYSKFNQDLKTSILFFKNGITFSKSLKNNYFKLGVSNFVSSRKNASDITIFQNDVIVSNPNNYKNDVTNFYSKSFFDINYTFRKERFDYQLNYKPSLFKIENNTLFGNDFDFNLSKKVGVENSFSVNYSFSNLPASILNTFENPYFVNYRNSTKKAFDYFKDNRNQIGLSIIYQYTPDLFFSNISINKSFVKSNSILNLISSQRNIERSFINFDNSYTTFDMKFGLAKYFFKIKANFKLKLNFQENEQNFISNTIFVESKTKAKSISLNFNPKVNKYFSFSSEYSFIENQYSSTINSEVNNIMIQKNDNKLDLFFFDDLSIQFANELVYFKNKDLNNFVDATFFYKKSNSKFEFSLSCTNILNKKSYYLEEFGVNSISSSTYYIRPNNYLLSCSYKF